MRAPGWLLGDGLWDRRSTGADRQIAPAPDRRLAPAADDPDPEREGGEAYRLPSWARAAA